MVVNFFYKILIGLIVMINFNSPPTPISHITIQQTALDVKMEQAAPNTYTALTYNIHRGTTKEGIPSLDKISNIIKKENPDFVALQEVDRYNYRSGFQDEIKKIADKLKMNYVFGPNLKYGLTEYGNGILSKYPILDSGQVKLALENEPRSLLWAKVKTNNGIIYVTSIHLGLDRIKREEHFKIIEDFSKKLDKPVVLMGDFNVLPNHPAFYQFRSRVSGHLFFKKIPTYINKRPIQIDYIFGRGINKLDMYSIPSNASDHYPLIMKFRIEKSPIKENITI